MLQDRARARERRDHGEAGRDQARKVHRGLRDPDHGPLGKLARREQARIAEAGDDVAVDALGLALEHLVQDADRGKGLIVVILDRGRTHRRADREDSVPGAAAARAAAPMLSVMDWVVFGLITLIRIASSLSTAMAHIQPRPHAQRVMAPAQGNRIRNS